MVGLCVFFRHWLRLVGFISIKAKRKKKQSECLLKTFQNLAHFKTTNENPCSKYLKLMHLLLMSDDVASFAFLQSITIGPTAAQMASKPMDGDGGAQRA